MIPTEVSKEGSGIVQFSVYLENTVDALYQLASLFGKEGPTLLSISTVDHHEASIFRLIFDYPDAAEAILEDHSIPYTLNRVLGVKLSSSEGLLAALATLAEAEVNLYYTYPLMVYGGTSCTVILSTEDSEFSSAVLQASGFTLLSQGDLAR